MGINDLKNLSKDDLLGALGLETKSGMGENLMSSLLMLGIGVAVGVGIGMLLAPKSGSDLRNDLSDQYRKTVGMAHDAMAQGGSGNSSKDSSGVPSSTSRSGSSGSGSIGSGSYGSNPV